MACWWKASFASSTPLGERIVSEHGAGQGIVILTCRGGLQHSSATPAARADQPAPAASSPVDLTRQHSLSVHCEAGREPRASEVSNDLEDAGLIGRLSDETAQV